MSKLLLEISIKDGFTRFYSKTMKPEVFETIVTASQPQENNILLPLTKWVLRLYEKNPNQTMNELRLLNIDGNINILQMFQRLKDLNLLTNNSADIGRYSSIRELYTVVTMFDSQDLEGDNTERKKRLMRPEFIEARNDIEILYEDDDWLVISPNSYEASVYWGHGTSWCTAYKDQRNYYDDYSRQGRLYINIDKENGDKYQFHFESDSFMDKYDHKIGKPVFENIEATPNLIKFYEEELTPTNFERLSENTNLYEFVESLNDNYFIAHRTEHTEVEYYDWEQEYNIIDSYSDGAKITYGFDDYEIYRESKWVRLLSGNFENVFDYQNGREIFDEWPSKVEISSDGNRITGLLEDKKIYVYAKGMNKGYYDEYKIADTIIDQHIYSIWEWDESEYSNIIDIENGVFLFDEFYDGDECTYYKGTLKPILLLWDVKNGIRKYNLNTSELSDVNLEVEYKKVRFLNDYQFAVEIDSAKGDEKWLIYDVDSLQPRFNGAEFDYVICSYETSYTPLVCYKGKWNIINFFKGKIAFPDLWFDDITPRCQTINNRNYFTASIGKQKYLITASGTIHDYEQEKPYSFPKEISRTDPEYITKEQKIKLSVNDMMYIINEAKRLINEISVKDAYAHYQDTIPEDVYKWWVVTIQGDNADNAQLDSDTKWVLKRYEKEGDSMFGKAEQIVNAINIFKRMRIRGMLPPDITLERCSSIDELIAFTNSVNHEAVFARTQKELDRDIKAAKNDIDVVFENDDWLVLIPKSMEASIYWGSKTKWCTATKTIENNQFKNYSENGPLYININKKTKAKYQFTFADTEWNDADNVEIPFPIMKNIDGSETLIPFYQKLCTGRLEWAKKPMFELEGFRFTNHGWTLCDELGMDCREVVNNQGEGNIITDSFNLLSDVWFDGIEENHPNYGFAMVNIGDGFYYFDYKKGLKNDKFAYFGGFLPMGKFSFYATRPDMKSIVMTYDEKFNLIDGNGKILLDTWFNEIDDDYENRCFIGKLNGEKYIIDRNNKIIKQ